MHPDEIFLARVLDFDRPARLLGTHGGEVQWLIGQHGLLCLIVLIRVVGVMFVHVLVDVIVLAHTVH